MMMTTLRYLHLSNSGSFPLLLLLPNYNTSPICTTPTPPHIRAGTMTWCNNNGLVDLGRSEGPQNALFSLQSPPLIGCWGMELWKETREFHSTTPFICGSVSALSPISPFAGWMARSLSASLSFPFSSLCRVSGSAIPQQQKLLPSISDTPKVEIQLERE